MSEDKRGTCVPLIRTATTNGSNNSSAEIGTHPKASYEEVVEGERLFMDTLEDLHKSLGTKFLVPTTGGKPLDLHRLFVEVTCRGGLQKVIGDRKWKEVTSAFSFPSTITNASFLLRKYYLSLLQTYEQVYFFRKRDSKLSLNEHPPLGVGSLVKGKINGKFENGYIITANFGSNILNGILYHVPFQSDGRYNSPLLSNNCGRKRSRRETDPSGLDSNVGGYNIFFAEHYSKLRPLYSGKEKLMVKYINSLWNNLTESEKEVYEDRDKERYNAGTSVSESS
ncbi:uncharacterized protein A4U43_C05F10740 [Asparagus officinalis]|uniref:ARID domain-containing protein n=1 Tax=Asparagus officinalis TaxID=4686 RepID=A0A5P1EQT2_ASPOF|nr:high mobility group B protein 15-like [Asparagus officinalis]ONK68372.1 uncharacterized protein A4U43_C05F10740 [Asparagus officinalis]